MTTGLAATTGSLVAQGQQAWSDINDAVDQAGQGSVQGSVTGYLSAASAIAQDMPPGEAKNVVNDVLAWGATGASIGTAIYPGIGTVIGAAVGAVIGAIDAIFGSGGGDNRPQWLVWTEAAPYPNMPGGKPPPANLGQFVLDLGTWWQAKNLAGQYDPAVDGLAILHAAQALGLLGTDTNAWKGRIGTEAFSLSGEIPGFSIAEVQKRWARWIPKGSPMYLPTSDDTFGWWLTGSFWQLAAQGNSDLDAMHYVTYLQALMVAGGGPSNEPHLMWLLGQLKALVKSSGPVVSQSLHLPPVVLTPAGAKPLATLVAQAPTDSQSAALVRKVMADQAAVKAAQSPLHALTPTEKGLGAAVLALLAWFLF